MKILIVMFFLISSTAFAKGKHYCEPLRTGIRCELQIALLCGNGYIDGCITRQTETHRCVIREEGTHVVDERMAPGTPCEEDKTFTCPEGFSDVCDP